MRFFVVGGAGFIGSHLVDLLVERGSVTVFDNLSVGKPEFIQAPLASGRAVLVRGDCLDLEAVTAAMKGHDVVFHLAANPEARWGLERTRLDLEQGTIATYNALEAARLNGVKRFLFASSGTVYGNVSEPCGENDLGSLPISLYGASKFAGEALLAAYAECFGLTGYITRFGNVVGDRGTHGAILDFCKKLKAHPEYLDVLGDGAQAKPYLHVTDCALGMLYVLDHAGEPGAGVAGESSTEPQLPNSAPGRPLGWHGENSREPQLPNSAPGRPLGWHGENSREPQLPNSAPGRPLGWHGENPAIFNLAPSDVTSVKRIAELVVAASPNKSARIDFGKSTQGWPGDVPRSRVKPDKLAALGFRVRYTSDQAVGLAVEQVAQEVFG